MPTQRERPVCYTCEHYRLVQSPAKIGKCVIMGRQVELAMLACSMYVKYRTPHGEGARPPLPSSPCDSYLHRVWPEKS